MSDVMLHHDGCLQPRVTTTIEQPAWATAAAYAVAVCECGAVHITVLPAPDGHR